MLKRNLGLTRTGVLLSSLVLVAPVAATADIFAYRTEDGVFAYTDDREKVPARYAADAVAVRDSHLPAYPRLTLEDTTAARAVTSRLEKRLDYLRQMNAASAAERAVASSASAANRTVVSVATGNAQAPTLDIATDGDTAPIVVEPLLTKATNDARTRRTTIVKQGDRTIAVLKGPRHNFDVSEDIHDEDQLIDPR
jgi:hypothetical protein